MAFKEFYMGIIVCFNFLKFIIANQCNVIFEFYVKVFIEI